MLAPRERGAHGEDQATGHTRDAGSHLKLKCRGQADLRLAGCLQNRNQKPRKRLRAHHEGFEIDRQPGQLIIKPIGIE